MINMFPLILTDHIEDTTQFYSSLFGLDVLLDVGWYRQLQHGDNPSLQLALMQADHDSVPSGFRVRPAGVIITLEFDDVDEIHARAKELGVTIHTELRDEEWGQRHFVTEDPAGLLVDVVQSIPPTAEFIERHGLAG